MMVSRMILPLAVATALTAHAARAEMPEMAAEEMAAWAEAYAGIKAMTPKWGVQGAEAFKASTDAGVPVVYLDVRTEDERAKGVVEGALEISLTELPTDEGVARLPEDRTAVIAVYCKSGHRSALAIPLLQRLGYANAVSMKGGYEGWVEAGYPVEGTEE